MIKSQVPGQTKATFRQVCTGSICRRCPRGMCALGRRRLRLVMERTGYWRTEPNWPRILSCEKTEKGDDTKRDEDCKMEVDVEAGSRKKLEMRMKDTTKGYA